MQADSALVGELRPSPNHGERRPGTMPSILLLHYTGMPSAEQAVDWLCNPASGVSCHYVILEDGRILQLVPEAARAWHAGLGSWAGENDVNSASIGIEIANPGHDGGYPDFPVRQIDATIALCRDIVARHRIAPRGLLAHSDTAPRRKADPGEKFPWERLAREGLGLWVPPAPLREGRVFGPGEEGQPVRALQALFAVFGYGLDITGVYDDQTEAVVRAFQRHFRPARVDGIADPSTLETLRDLIRKAGLAQA